MTTRRANEPESEATRAEWAVAAVSALLVGSALGFVAYKAVTESDAPPVITFELDRVVRAGDRWVVEFFVVNTGGITAEDLIVEGALEDPEEGPVEVRQVTLSFVPAGARREAGLFFENDPRGHDLVLRPVGYDVP